MGRKHSSGLAGRRARATRAANRKRKDMRTHRRSRFLLAAFSVAALTALAAGMRAQQAGDAPRTGEPTAKARPSLVLVTIDTLRADHLSCYGYFRKTSPAIDALAADSIVFERCYATIPHTTPSHASLLTGVLPFEHGITANFFMASEARQRMQALTTSPHFKTYAQILKQHGWKTGGFVSSATTKKITGLAAGFDAWTEPSELGRRGTESLEDALQWLRTVGPEPFFLWLHLFDVHGVPEPRDRDLEYGGAFAEDDALRAHMKELAIPEEFARNERSSARPTPVINGYDGSIRHVDGLVQTLVDELRRLGAWERTAFVLTADHGEGLGQHEFMGHGLVWGEQLRVPLIVHVAGSAPERRDDLMSGIDVLPTLLDLLPGFPRDELLAQARGRSVVAADFEPRPVFSMSPSGKDEYALTATPWKFIHRPKGSDALYHLRDDPHELHDVIGEQPRVAAALKQLLFASMKEQRNRHTSLLRGGTMPPISAEEEAKHLEELRKLGYVDGEAAGDHR